MIQLLWPVYGVSRIRFASNWHFYNVQFIVQKSGKGKQQPSNSSRGAENQPLTGNDTTELDERDGDASPDSEQPEGANSDNTSVAICGGSPERSPMSSASTANACPPTQPNSTDDGKH